jgi:hypothetical protein
MLERRSGTRKNPIPMKSSGAPWNLEQGRELRGGHAPPIARYFGSRIGSKNSFCLALARRGRTPSARCPADVRHLFVWHADSRGGGTDHRRSKRP